MRIAYLTDFDPRDVRHWSGLGLHILRCLRQQGLDVEPIGPIPWRRSASAGYAAAKFVLYNHALRQKAGHYSRYLEPALMRLWAKQYRARLENRSFDLIFSPFTQHLAYLETDIPMVTWADATFCALDKLYNADKPLCRENRKSGNLLESRALKQISLAIYASEWAAESAIKDYGLPRERVAVIPYGANLEFTPGQSQVEQLIEGRSHERLELLFTGVAFERKGGPCAVEVARRLNAAGVPARLTIVGCRPQIDEPFVEVLGFLSKSNPQDRERFETVLGRSHFFILPSRAECYGVVFCEASSFGVPSIATHVGGIPTAVRDGVNGRLFPPTPDPGDIATWITGVTRDSENYRRLALSSYQEYAERLNWTSAGTELFRALERVVADAVHEPPRRLHRDNWIKTDTSQARR